MYHGFLDGGSSQTEEFSSSPSDVHWKSIESIPLKTDSSGGQRTDSWTIPGIDPWSNRRTPGRTQNYIKGLVLTLIFDSLPELKILKNGCSSLSNENVTMDTKCPIYSFPANTIQIFKLITYFGAYQSTYNKTNHNS